MAFDKILMYNNTSIIQDEVLAHRLGLVPLKADARCFVDRPYSKEHSLSNPFSMSYLLLLIVCLDDGNETAENTLKFRLKIKCKWRDDRPPDTTIPNKLYSNHKGTS